MIGGNVVLLLCFCLCPMLFAEVLAVYEDEVVRLEQLVQQSGAQRGVPGLIYELADLQVSSSTLRQPALVLW